MFADLILFAALQVGPFFETAPDFTAVRPFWSEAAETTDVLWPVFTSHDDWWRLCLFTHYQTNDRGYQFEVMPLWFNGEDAEKGAYAGLFPLYGRHPHFLLMYDFEFCLWPVWTRYRMPRKSAPGGWLTSNAVLFPFVSWRDDGAWGFWPFYGVNYQRESDHRYALWPLFTWADYRPDRDTAGAGNSWMFWPLVGRIERERESMWMFIPPLFSYVETSAGWRLRAPYPLFELERMRDRHRLSVFPLYEHVSLRQFKDGVESQAVTRFLWRLVEVYSDGETRVFPFWTSKRGYFRLWPLWEEAEDERGEVSVARTLALFPIRWVDAIDRNWAKFWTFYERVKNPVCTDHSLLWGLISWRTFDD